MRTLCRNARSQVVLYSIHGQGQSLFPAFSSPLHPYIQYLAPHHGPNLRLISQGDKKKAIHASSNREDEEHILGILASLLTNLPSDSTGRIRVLAKFVDDEYAKVERLLELREGAVGRLSGVEGEIQTERDVSIEVPNPCHHQSAVKPQIRTFVEACEIREIGSLL